MTRISGVEVYYNRNAGRRMRRRMRNVLLTVIAAALVYGWWSTRDTTPRWELVPAGRPVCVVIQDPLDRKARIASSALWQALPSTGFIDQIRAAIAQDPGLPEWLLRNVLGRAVYISAADWEDQSSAIVLTRMTRIGVLAERTWSYVGRGVERDYAGGLRIRSVDGTDLFYAVRGRTLIASPSRDTLISCLTLAEGDAVSAETFRETLDQNGSEDVRGNIVLAAGQPGADLIHAIAFALRLDDREARIRGRVQLQPALEARLADLLTARSVESLPQPPDGIVRVSLDLGVPLDRVADVVAAALGGDETRWQEWRRMPDSMDGAIPYLLTRLVDASGPGVTASITGADLNEMVPVPIVVWSAEGDGSLVSGLGEMATAAAGEGLSHPPVYDDVLKLVAFPYVGGPSLTPTIASYRGQLWASNSRPAIEDLIKHGPAPRRGPGYTGNLAVEVEPGDLTDMVLDIGQLLADAGAVRGFTGTTFLESAAQWRDQAHKFGTTVLVGSVMDRAVDLELTLRLADPANAPSPAQP